MLFSLHKHNQSFVNKQIKPKAGTKFTPMIKQLNLVQKVAYAVKYVVNIKRSETVASVHKRETLAE